MSEVINQSEYLDKEGQETTKGKGKGQGRRAHYRH